VVKQLKGIFSYKSFGLLDSFVLRSRDAEKGDTSGFVPASGAERTRRQQDHLPVQVSAREFGWYRGQSGDSVRPVEPGMRVPVASSNGQFTYVEAGISTDVDVPEGKKVVVGKTSAVEGADSALILVISAKVVD